jgi:hypothetical protein
MPVPKADEIEVDEETTSQKAEKTAKMLFEKSKPIAQQYGSTILAVLVLFGLLYFWMFMLPKPVSVTITLKTADTNQPVGGAQVSANYLASPFIFTGNKENYAVPSSNDDGRYTFNNVPSNTDIPIEITADGYESAGVTVTTDAAGGDATKTVALYQKTTLQITPPNFEVSGAIGPSCTKNFSVTVYNNDTSDSGADQNALLIDDLGTLPGFLPYPATVSPQASANAYFSLTTAYPADTSYNDIQGTFLTGTVRIEGTEKKAQVNISIDPTAKLDVSPSEIQSNNIGDAQDITIKNDGSGKITNVMISFAPGSENLVNLVGLNANAPFDLDPGQTVTGFANATAAGLGKISISADCMPTQEIRINNKNIGATNNGG